MSHQPNDGVTLNGTLLPDDVVPNRTDPANTASNGPAALNEQTLGDYRSERSITRERAEEARPYDLVILSSFGGPEGPDEVLPFLRRVTAGRGIPDERLVEVGAHYSHFGGRSPINDQNRALKAALEAELARRGIELPVLWGNRNWHPYVTDVVAQAHAEGKQNLLGLATSAYSSYSGCRQYREDFGMALRDLDLADQLRIDKLRHYFNLEGFLAPVADGVVAGVRQLVEAGVGAEGLMVMYSTHSVPDTMADASGPADTRKALSGGWYVAQHQAAIDWVHARVEAETGLTLAHELVFQSRSGNPRQPWLEPDINDAIEDAAQAGRTGTVCVPIGFVSDHVEVVWDLDTEAKETAEELGLAFVRTPTAGTDPRFVAALVDRPSTWLRQSTPHRTALVESRTFAPWPHQSLAICLPTA
mgnify:CR=1 FL=1